MRPVRIPAEPNPSAVAAVPVAEVGVVLPMAPSGREIVTVSTVPEAAVTLTFCVASSVRADGRAHGNL